MQFLSQSSNPALLAKMLSTLDIISEGRIELGIGAGWHKEEYRQYGYNFPPAPIRIEQLDEAITIVKSMWTEGRATFRGKHYSINGAICNPKPVQKPHPVIMVGGEGERYLLKIAAKHADRYNHPCGTIKTLKRKISILKEYCISIGRDHERYRIFDTSYMSSQRNRRRAKRRHEAKEEAASWISTGKSEQNIPP